MIALTRLACPAILEEKQADWTRNYQTRLATKPGRPSTSQYGHPQVRRALEAMSHAKCFYCESRGRMTVDRHVELAERLDLAFDWTNLYLACVDCQNKQPNRAISTSACVDPCDGATEPRDHLAFEDEVVTARTPQGDATIRKYGLGRGQLLGERRRVLRSLDRLVRELGRHKPWPDMTPREREVLWRFARADGEFSAMVAAFLDSLAVERPLRPSLTGGPAAPR